PESAAGICVQRRSDLDAVRRALSQAGVCPGLQPGRWRGCPDFVIRPVIQSCFWLVAAALLLVACGSGTPEAPKATATDTADLDPMVEPWHGDLDGMIERRQIRVLVPYSKTFYFLDSGGHQRGLSFDFMESFEDWLNEQRHAGLLRTRVVYIPVTRDRLIPWLIEGRGDVIAANLTVTERRREQVGFTTPIRRSVNEVLVSGPDAVPLHSLEALARRTV